MFQRSLSTLDYAYAELVASLDHAVQDHSNLSDALTSQVVEAAKGLERQHDEIKKKVIIHMFISRRWMRCSKFRETLLSIRLLLWYILTAGGKTARPILSKDSS